MVFKQISVLTRQRFGTAINPHAFCHAATTSIALDDPHHSDIAARVLGHAAGSKTMQAHYNLAGAFAAAQQWQAEVRRLRGRQGRRRPEEGARRRWPMPATARTNSATASSEDQLRLCRELAGRLSVDVAECFAEGAASAAPARRPGYQAMLEFVRAGGVDMVLADSLDRLCRDQEDTAACSSGWAFSACASSPWPRARWDLHVGLKGAMNALYLKDLAQKTRRGLEGRVRAGRSAGGLCYGYAVVRELGVDGPVHGSGASCRRKR